MIALGLFVAGTAGVAVWNTHTGVGALEGTGDTLSLQDNSCSVLWALSLKDYLTQGWASRWTIALVLDARFVKMGPCMWVQPKSYYDEIIRYGMTPFQEKTAVCSDQEWGGIVQDAIQNGREIQKETVTYVSGNWPGEEVSNWIYGAAGGTYTMQCFVGCWPQFDDVVLTTFAPLMASMPRPFTSAFIGMHVRHGDKGGEGVLVSLDTLMTKAETSYGAINQVFLATDDARVIEEEVKQFPGHQFNWATGVNRHDGGEPLSVNGMNSNHDHNLPAIAAALQDTVNLAVADVMLGSYNSNFFRLSWVLNYLRRTQAERQVDWCFDGYTGTACVDRPNFVKAFWAAHPQYSRTTDEFLNCGNPLS